jgi:hypothetical protein
MATKQIYWGDGSSDKIMVTYSGEVGSSQMAVASDPNNFPEERTKEITLKSAGGVALGTLTVSQLGAPTLSVNPESYTFADNEAEKFFNVTTNQGSFSAVWGTPISGATITVTSEGFYVQFSALMPANDVSGTIIVTAGALSMTVNVVKLGSFTEPSVDPSAFLFAYNNTTAKQFYVSNVGSNYTVAWKSDNQMTGATLTKNSSGFTVKCSVNTSSTLLSGIVVVTSGTRHVEVVLTQSRKL